MLGWSVWLTAKVMTGEKRFDLFHGFVISRVMIGRLQSIIIRPKLKFYFFPLTRPTLKKRPCSKKNISIFSQEFFFKIPLQTKRIVQCKQCYLRKLFVYLILLPLVGLYSKTCLKWPLKDIHNKGR